MSGYIHVEHQLGFLNSETIQAKQNYGKTCFDHVILVNTYLADNRFFKANNFVQHIHNNNQCIFYCGINAHCKNSVAERSICTVSEISHAMMLHLSLFWKNGIGSNLWPMATSYSNYILNQMLNAEYIAPDYLFNGTKFPCNKLKYIHVWGCTVYVLDPTLQQGRKLPKWQQQSHCRIFVGSSQNHSSNFPLILNQATGHISPQFNVIFDDSFSTALSFSLE